MEIVLTACYAAVAFSRAHHGHLGSLLQSLADDKCVCLSGPLPHTRLIKRFIWGTPSLYLLLPSQSTLAPSNLLRVADDPPH